MALKPPRPLLIFLVCVFAVLAAGWALPASRAVERSDEIAAPPATVYELLTDLRVERRWSPWRDAHAHYLFSGPTFGPGSLMEWSGASRGSARVVSALPYSRVEQRLRLAGRSLDSLFSLSRSAQGTHIVWRLEERFGINPLARWSGLLFPRTAAVEMARGLDRLGDVAEALPHADLQAFDVKLVEAAARPFAYVEGKTEPSPEAVARALASASRQVASGLAAAGLTPEGGPVWSAWPTDGEDGLTYHAGLAFNGGVAGSKPSGSVKTGVLGGGWAVAAEHGGGLGEVAQAQAAIRLFQSVHQLTPSGPDLAALSGDPAGARPEMLTVRLSAPVQSGL